MYFYLKNNNLYIFSKLYSSWTALTAGFVPCMQKEVKEHVAILGFTSGHHAKLPSRCCLSRPSLLYKSVATQNPQIAGLALKHCAGEQTQDLACETLAPSLHQA